MRKNRPGRGRHGKLQFIAHPAGKERLVVLPETEFRMLRQAAAAGPAGPGHFDRTGPFPKDLLDQLNEGENPVRAIRLRRGLSGRQLAGLAGISASMLSQIERTGKTGSTRTFKTIANILNVPMDLIFPSRTDDL